MDLYKNTKITLLWLFVGVWFCSSQFLYAQSLMASTLGKERITGSIRYQTANAISQQGWESSDYAVLVRGDDFADGLSACPLAHKYSAPILMTQPTKLDRETLQELKRLGVKHLLIVGGFEAVAQDIEDTLEREGITTIERIYGDNRYQTSAKIAEKFSTSEVALVTGEDYIDALSITVIAAIRGMPILLTPRESLPEDISSYLVARAITKTYIIGGEEVISREADLHVPGPIRLAGSNRFETNAIILNLFASELDFTSLYVAGGDEEFANALAGGILAARTSSPLVFVDSNHSLTTITNLQVELTKNARIIGLGNEQAVPSKVLEAILSYVADSVNNKNYTNVGSDSGLPSVVSNKVSFVGSTSTEEYYKAGDTIEITITFDNQVEVTGTPSLHLATGGLGGQATYIGGSGTSVLSFNYQVQTGDTSTNLDYVGTESLSLNGGRIKTAGTNIDADTTLPAPGESGSISKDQRIIIDTTSPMAIDISLHNVIPPYGYLTLSVDGGPLSDSSWQAIFEQIKCNTEDGDIWITGISSLDLTMIVADDGETATINNTSSQQAIITQDFVIPASKVVDRAGNNTRDNIVINSYVVVVTGVESSTENGYYKEGELINITIRFSGDVDVTETPLLHLETGENDQKAIYTEGSGSSVLSFTYTVQAGDTSANLDYLGIDSLDINGGSIKIAGSDEDIISFPLAVPGETGSISSSKKIIIDTTAPSTIAVSSQNIIPKGESVDLNVVGGPLPQSSWLSILSQIKTNTTNGDWIRGISKNDLEIDIYANGASAKLNNISPNDALIVSDFIISADKVIDRAGNVALCDIQIDSYNND